MNDFTRFQRPPVPRNYRIDALLTALAVLIALSFGLWLVWPILNDAVGNAAMEPSACRGLTPHECIALAQDGGW